MTRTLAYSVLVGPILWFAHFLLVYAVAEFGCRANFNNLLVITPATIRLVILLLTVPAALAVGVGGVLAYRDWQRMDQDETPARFLVLLGMIFSALFLIAIAFTVVPTFVLNICDKAV